VNSFKKVCKVVFKIPKGKVLIYGKIAEISEIKNPRLVGSYLHRNQNPVKIPCHRVVKSDGRLASGYAFGGIKKQKEILIKEGVSFNLKGRIDLKKYLFTSQNCLAD